MENKMQYIIQFGSGKPGEMGTEKTEQEVFARLGLKNPLVGFLPFHRLVKEETGNDWRLFRKIMEPLSTVRPLLFELHLRKDIIRLKEKLHRLDVLVLGAGYVEPYLRAIVTNGLLPMIQDFFRQGGVLIGYSAGSCALASVNVNAVSWDRIFDIYTEMVMTKAPRRRIYKQMALSLCTSENRNEVQKLLEDIDKGQSEWNNSLLCREVPQVFFGRALNFVGASALYPHYREHAMGMPWHLEAASRLRTDIKHVGIPNGICLFHTCSDGLIKSSEFIGQHPNTDMKAEIWQGGEKTTSRSSEHKKSLH